MTSLYEAFEIWNKYNRYPTHTMEKVLCSDYQKAHYKFPLQLTITKTIVIDAEILPKYILIIKKVILYLWNISTTNPYKSGWSENCNRTPSLLTGMRQRSSQQSLWFGWTSTQISSVYVSGILCTRWGSVKRNHHRQVKGILRGLGWSSGLWLDWELKIGNN